MSDAIERAGAAMPAVSGEVRFAGFGDVWRFAEAMAEARGFVPDAYIGKPAALAACVMTGLELGLGPMAAIRGLHNVKGKIMLDASLVAALAIRGGVQIDYEVNTDAEVRVRLSRGGRSHVESFTMRDAERAGLTAPTRSGEPSMYAKYPRRMLQARALGIAVRAWCPDVLGGPVYVEGELDAPAEQPREVHATVVPEPAPEPQRSAKPAKDPVLARILREELPDCAHADALRGWAEQHAERLSALVNGQRDAARRLIAERCRALTDADRDEAAVDALADEVTMIAGLA